MSKPSITVRDFFSLMDYPHDDQMVDIFGEYSPDSPMFPKNFRFKASVVEVLSGQYEDDESDASEFDDLEDEDISFKKEVVYNALVKSWSASSSYRSEDVLLHLTVIINDAVEVEDEEGSFTAYIYEDDGVTPCDLSTYDMKQEAIQFAKQRKWDEVVNDNTGAIVWKREK